MVKPRSAAKRQKRGLSYASQAQDAGTFDTAAFGSTVFDDTVFDDTAFDDTVTGQRRPDYPVPASPP
jgi:hypothetical protein